MATTTRTATRTSRTATVTGEKRLGSPPPARERHPDSLREDVTLLELVDAVSSVTDNEQEVVATVVHMLERGTVKLQGAFRGQPIRWTTTQR